MPLRPGFKQTDVGLIPEDWDTPELGTILRSVQLGGNYKNSGRETSWPLIKMGNLGRGTIKVGGLEFVDSDHAPSVRDKLEEDDVLLNTRNTLELVGKVAIWRNELPEAYFNSNIMRMEFDEARVSSNRFMSYILNSRESLDALRGIAIGTTSVAAIYSRDLVRLRVALPPKAEQQAIAEALTDADALIEASEQLIAKKRLVKQGAMQDLLGGRRRLPGFSGDWNTSNLESVTVRMTGVWGADELSDARRRRAEIIRAGDISPDGQLVDTAERYLSQTEYSKAHCRLDDIVITASGNGLGKVWWCDGRPDVAASNFVRILRPRRERAQGLFLSYVLRTPTALRQLGEHTATSAYPNLRPSFFSAEWLRLPPVEEQRAIATILSAVDAEIGALEAKLEKARLVKQGMMQCLLTGRIRLS